MRNAIKIAIAVNLELVIRWPSMFVRFSRYQHSLYEHTFTLQDVETFRPHKNGETRLPRSQRDFRKFTGSVKAQILRGHMRTDIRAETQRSPS